MKNKKGQFFIASAVIIIFVVTAVFFFLAGVGQITNTSLIQREASTFSLNLREEFGRVVETSLSIASKDPTLTPSDILDSNLSNFSRFVVVQGLERGFFANVSAARTSASNTSMNISLNLSLASQGSNLDLRTSVYREINITAFNGSLVTMPTCTLNVSAKKEFGEPISELNSSNIIFKINNTACASPTYAENTLGKYNATCPASTCVSSNVSIEVTDHRGIFSHSRIPNTGQGNGCAASCGQPLD